MNDIILRTKTRRRPIHLDRVIRRSPVSPPVRTPPRPKPIKQPIQPKPLPRMNPPAKAAAPQKKRQLRLPLWLQTILAVPALMAAALLIQSSVVGQFVIAAYGLAALILRIPSRTTFILALLSFITTTFLLVGRGKVSFAQTFATYTFLLLVVGVISLGRELKKEGGRIYSIRQQNKY
jgi:hypothetical protein